MIGPATIPAVLLLAGSAFASQVHGARDVTTEAIIAVTEGGTTVFTTVTSIIKPTATPIDTSTACYCSIPVTTATATTTICPCQTAPTDVTAPQSIDAPTTESIAAAASEETPGLPGQSWLDDAVLVGLKASNDAVTRVVSVQLAAVATFFGLIGVGVVLL